MSSGQEIERKFLVKKAGAPWRALASSSSHIQQGYFDCRGASVRIRTRDEKAYLTIKSHSLDGGLSRYEFEKEIEMDEAQQLLKLCKGGLVDKQRYLVPAGDGIHTFEVDEFFGANEGLVFAEVELSAVDEEYAKPSFIAQEVTGSRYFRNSNLLVSPYSEWKDLLPEECK